MDPLPGRMPTGATPAFHSAAGQPRSYNMVGMQSGKTPGQTIDDMMNDAGGQNLDMGLDGIDPHEMSYVNSRAGTYVYLQAQVRKAAD
jgi:hypothetical protein